jgi:hypothetical protein
MIFGYRILLLCGWAKRGIVREMNHYEILHTHDQIGVTMTTARLDARNLAQTSYVIAFVTAAIILLVVIIGLIPSDALRIVAHIAWLALPSSAIGLAMALMARTDFQRSDPGAEWWNRMRVGLRINAFALATMLLLLVAVGLPALMAIANPF